MQADVLIAYAQVTSAGVVEAEFLSRLPEYLARRISGMRSESAKLHSVTGYRLLELAAESAGVGPLAIGLIEESADGRPTLPSGPDFNISHSRGLVGCAIGINCRVGFDVERIRAANVPRLKRFLSSDEAAECAHDPSAFFFGWAAREASVKAGGQVGLARISRVQITGPRSSVDDETWHLRYPDLTPDYAACLACDKQDSQLRIHDFSRSLTKYSAA